MRSFNDLDRNKQEGSTRNKNRRVETLQDSNSINDSQKIYEARELCEPVYYGRFKICV